MKLRFSSFVRQEGSVDTGGSDWTQHSHFDPSDEREPLAQVLLAHAIDSAASQITRNQQHDLSHRQQGGSNSNGGSGGDGIDPGDSATVVASGPAAVFPRLCASSAAAARRAAETRDEDEHGVGGYGIGARMSITTEDSTLGAMEDDFVAEEEEPLALPTEMLWQPAAYVERKAKVRSEKHVLWPADLVF